MNTNNNEITILIVGNTSEDLRILANKFEQLSYTVLQAPDGNFAFSIVDKRVPDAILLEINVPGMDGFEVCRLLKKRESLQKIPILFLSALTDLQNKIKAFQCGGTDYITKPFQFEEIKVRLENQLAYFRYRLEVKQKNHISEQALSQLKKEVKERKRVEDALRQSEERYRKLVESSEDAIISCDIDGTINRWNHSAETIFDYTPIEALGQSISIIIPEQYYQDHHGGICQSLQSENLELIGKPIELTGKTKDGTVIPIEVSFLFQKSGNRQYLHTLIIKNITERKMIEAELLKVQKLESLGILAGGIAHDFNNYLAGILGNITLAKIDAHKNEKLCNRLEKIEKVTLLSRKLTNQLITFSKGGAPITKTVSIKEVIEDSISLSLRGSNVTCHPSIPNGIWPVEIDVGQITQAINNLIINAYQAMPNGGIIQVRVINSTLKKQEIPHVKPGNYIKILIEDQGVGIEKGIIKNIFNPFFTTKQEGSGLGLTTCYSIIKNHGGTICVESEKGVGTRFSIYLPASKIKIQQKDTMKDSLTTYTGRILLMDDEELIREATGSILKNIGYDVALAQEGFEAIKLYKEFKAKGDPFDLVILDLTVCGGLGGIATMKELLKIDPEAKVIVTSGYSKATVMTKYREYGFSGVIVKPYNIQELGKILLDVKAGCGK